MRVRIAVKYNLINIFWTTLRALDAYGLYCFTPISIKIKVTFLTSFHLQQIQPDISLEFFARLTFLLSFLFEKGLTINGSTGYPANS